MTKCESCLFWDRKVTEYPCGECKQIIMGADHDYYLEWEKEDKHEQMDMLFTRTFEDLKKRLEEKMHAELDKDRKLDARTVGICLGIMDNVIDDMLEDEGDE